MLLMVLSACDDSGKKSSSSVRQAELPKVAVMEAAEREAKFTASTAARAVAFRVAEVRPQISGIIKKRLFTEGSHVKEGEILYLLDDAIYRAAYESAKADWVQAKANLVPLKLKRERSKAMLASSSISQQDYNDANAAYLAGEAECISRKAAMDEAAVRLGYTSITASLSGEIGLSSVTEGALVTEHQAEKLSSIWQTDPMYVVMALPVAEWAKARSMAEEGPVEKETFGRVRIFLEDGTPYPGECRIDFSEVSAEESTGNILLRAAVSNPSRILLPRMALRAEVTLGISRHAVFLPPAICRGACACSLRSIRLSIPISLRHR